MACRHCQSEYDEYAGTVFLLAKSTSVVFSNMGKVKLAENLFGIHPPRLSPRHNLPTEKSVWHSSSSFISEA
jgi:hypothetical protein